MVDQVGFDIVHDDYGKRALDFVQDMQRLVGFDEVCQRILSELDWFGFSHVTIGDLPGPGSSPNVFLNTRPADYSEHYQRQDYFSKDPVVLRLGRAFEPFAWDDVRNERLSRQGRAILDEARDFDVRDGLLVPIVSGNGSLSMFSPCGRQPNLTPRARCALEMIGIYSYQTLRRTIIKEHRDPTIKQVQPLTPREREIMKWVATGKSDEEIATILSISRETATTHVENAKRKLNATRRTYAVVQALRVGEITL